MDKNVSVKDGKDIELDGVTVINTLSVAEKKEEKTEEPVQAPVAESAEPAISTVTQTPVTTIESTISSLNPTIPNIPNTVNPTPIVTSTSDVSPLTSSSIESDINANSVVQPPLANVQPVEQNYGQSYDIDNQYINNEYSNTLENEVGESVFKDATSVTTSRDLFLKQVGELFDERLTDPVNTSVVIANESMKLLNDVFQHGMNVSSFKKYQELMDLYNGIKNVDAAGQEKEEPSNETNDYNPFGISNNDLSNMNIPRF